MSPKICIHIFHSETRTPPRCPYVIGLVLGALAVSCGAADHDEGDGRILIETQSGVAALAGVQAVKGHLSVGGTVNDVSALSSLQSIDGSLSVWGEMVNVDGLSSLRSVGEHLSVSGQSLLNVHGFRSLERVGGDLSISGNDSLARLDGFESLEAVGGSVSVLNNDVLVSLAGLNALETVGAELTLEERMERVERNSNTGLAITNNAILPTCEAERLRDNIDTIAGSSALIIENDDSGVCH